MRLIPTSGDFKLDQELNSLEARLNALEAKNANTSPGPAPQRALVVQTGVRSLSGTSPLMGDVTLAGAGAVVVSQSGQVITLTVPSSGSSKTTTFSGARVFNSGSQSSPNSTETALTFDSERYDTDAYHSVSSNTSRLVAPVTGYYRITANIEWDAGVGQTMLTATMSIRLNGATFLASSDAPVGIRFVKQDVVCEYKLTAGDYVEITTNGSVAVGTPNIINAGNFSPEASISLMGV